MTIALAEAACPLFDTVSIFVSAIVEKVDCASTGPSIQLLGCATLDSFVLGASFDTFHGYCADGVDFVCAPMVVVPKRERERARRRMRDSNTRAWNSKSRHVPRVNNPPAKQIRWAVGVGFAAPLEFRTFGKMSLLLLLVLNARQRRHSKKNGRNVKCLRTNRKESENKMRRETSSKVLSFPQSFLHPICRFKVAINAHDRASNSIESRHEFAVNCGLACGKCVRAGWKFAICNCASERR